MGKYGNKTVVINGERFDSKREEKRWKELLLLQEAGVIRDLKRQVKFELVPTQYESYERKSKKGKPLKPGVYAAEKSVNYYADFTYYTQDGEYVVEDAKGKRTQAYIIKRKLMLYIHHIKIREV